MHKKATCLQVLGPDFDRTFTRMFCASLRHIWQGERAHVCFLLSPHLYTFASAYRATHYFSWLPSTSISYVRLKSFIPPYMNMTLRFIKNYLEFYMG
jgi:hypothetical protein